MENFVTNTCLNCGSAKFKTWEELTEDEKFVIEKLPDNTKHSAEDRKKQRFCKGCFYTESVNNPLV